MDANPIPPSTVLLGEDDKPVVWMFPETDADVGGSSVDVGAVLRIAEVLRHVVAEARLADPVAADELRVLACLALNAIEGLYDAAPTQVRRELHRTLQNFEHRAVNAATARLLLAALLGTADGLLRAAEAVASQRSAPASTTADPPATEAPLRRVAGGRVIDLPHAGQYL